MEHAQIEVDPGHYVSPPQKAWDEMLKKAGVTLYLITDPAMYLLLESGMQGALCMISKRHARPNNAQVGNLDREQPLSYIVEMDAYNLHGWAMSQFLPMSGIHWVPKEEWESWD